MYYFLLFQKRTELSGRPNIMLIPLLKTTQVLFGEQTMKSD